MRTMRVVITRCEGQFADSRTRTDIDVQVLARGLAALQLDHDDVPGLLRVPHCSARVQHALR